MWPFLILKRLPRSVSSTAILAFALAGVAWRWLTGTTRGILVLVVGVYGATMVGCESKPLSAQELLLWFSEQSPELRIGLASTVVTVIGFLIAFHSATLAWRDQALLQMRLSTAADLDAFFNEASDLLIEIMTFVAEVLDILTAIDAKGFDDDVQFRLKRAQGRLQHFEKAQSRLVEMGRQTPQLFTRHQSVMANVWNISVALERAILLFHEAVATTWLVFPLVEDDRIRAEFFVERATRDEWEKCERTCSVNVRLIGGLIGWVRGVLVAPVAGFSFSGALVLLKERRNIERFLDDFAEKDVPRAS